MKLIPIYCAAGSNSNPGNDSQPFHRTHPPHPREGNFPDVLTWDWKSWLPLAMFPHYTCSFHLLWTKRMFDLYRCFYIKFLRETGKDTLWRAWKEVILFWILFGVFFFEEVEDEKFLTDSMKVTGWLYGPSPEFVYPNMEKNWLSLKAYVFKCRLLSCFISREHIFFSVILFKACLYHFLNMQTKLVMQMYFAPKRITNEL